MTRIPETDPVPPARPRIPGGWPVTAAFLAAAIVCIAASIAFYLNPSAQRERLTSPVRPQLTLTPSSATPSPAADDPDVTERFREFALVGEKFPPEWLVRVERVYWSDTGGLWAEATLPRNARERAFTIETICRELSAYVTEVVRRDWPGVSVRSVDGAELVTRARPDDSCEPGAG